MALSNKYGKIDIPNIPDDEPVFIIRANDAYCVPAIVEYLRILNMNGVYLDRDEYRKITLDMANWSPKKIPD